MKRIRVAIGHAGGKTVHQIGVRFQYQRGDKLLRVLMQVRFSPLIQAIPGIIRGQIGHRHICHQRDQIGAQKTESLGLDRVVGAPADDGERAAVEKRAEGIGLLRGGGFDRADAGNRLFPRHDPVVEEDRMIDDEGGHAKAGRIADPEASRDGGVERRRPVPAFSDSDGTGDIDGQRQMLAITLCWFAMGFVNALPGVALRQFLIEELEASPAIQAIIYGVIGPMPWNFKFVAAFISDACPLCGYRRLPYVVGALLLQCAGWVLLSQLQPDIVSTAALRFMTLVGSMLHGVMCDTIVVETMKKHETAAERGKLQSGTWLAGLAGGLVATPLGGWLLEFWPMFSNRGLMQVCSVS